MYHIGLNDEIIRDGVLPGYQGSPLQRCSSLLPPDARPSCINAFKEALRPYLHHACGRPDSSAAYHPEEAAIPNVVASELQVMAPVRSFASSTPGSTVVMLPSTRDVHHHPVFPTPPFDPADSLAGPPAPAHPSVPLPPNIIMLPNPGLFKIGETLVGAMTTDVLKHLAGQEAFRNAPGQATDRMACLASHLLGQRR